MVNFCIIALAIANIIATINIVTMYREVDHILKENARVAAKVTVLEVENRRLHDNIQVLIKQDEKLMSYIRLIDKEIQWDRRDREIFKGGG